MLKMMFMMLNNKVGCGAFTSVPSREPVTFITSTFLSQLAHRYHLQWPVRLQISKLLVLRNLNHSVHEYNHSPLVILK